MRHCQHAALGVEAERPRRLWTPQVHRLLRHQAPDTEADAEVGCEQNVAAVRGPSCSNYACGALGNGAVPLGVADAEDLAMG